MCQSNSQRGCYHGTAAGTHLLTPCKCFLGLTVLASRFLTAPASRLFTLQVPLDVTSLPCLYVFVDISIDVDHLVETVELNFP